MIKSIITVVCLLVILPIFAKTMPANETLYYDINYGFITGGYASIKSRSDSGGTYMQALANSTEFLDNFYKVRNKVETWLDTCGVSKKFSKKNWQGKKREWRVHYYNQVNNNSIYQDYDYQKRQFVETVMSIPTATQDVLNAFRKIRYGVMNIGDSLSFDVTIDGVNLHSKVIILAKEYINTFFGKKLCFKIEPVLGSNSSVFNHSGRMFLWITADNERLPVLIKSQVLIGSVRVELVGKSNEFIE